MAGGRMIGVRFNPIGGGTVATRYFHTDNLGSIVALTDDAGNVAQRIVGACPPAA